MNTFYETRNVSLQTDMHGFAGVNGYLYFIAVEEIIGS